MLAIPATNKENFLTLLAAPGRSSEIPESHDVYGWLAGSWKLEAVHYKGVDVSGPGAGGRGLLRLGAGRPGGAGCVDYAALPTAQRADR